MASPTDDRCDVNQIARGGGGLGTSGGRFLPGRARPGAGRASRCPQTQRFADSCCLLGDNSGLSVVPISIEHMLEMTDRPVPGQALLAAALVELRSACADDGERIDRIGFLERAKSVLAAVQVQLMVDFETSQLAAAGSAGCAGAAAGAGDRGSDRLRDQVFAGVGVAPVGGRPGVGDGDARTRWTLWRLGGCRSGVCGRRSPRRGV